MIKRINLIEEKPFAITYMKLVQMIMVVVVLNFAAARWQGYRLSALKPQFENALNQTQMLKEEKRSLEKKPVIKKQETVEVGEYQDLFEVLNAYPKWAGVVEEITSGLPNSVWLTQISTSTQQKVNQDDTEAAPEKPESKSKDKTKEKKQKAPPPESEDEEKTTKLEGPGSIQISLTGLATDVDNLSLFVKNLQSSSYFSRTTIDESQKESFGFNFRIVSFLNLEYVED